MINLNFFSGFQPNFLDQTVIDYDDKTRLNYVGTTEDGRPSGRGVMLFKDGSNYTGEWRSGKQHGQGILTYPENDPFKTISFEGLFENDDFKYGTMIWRSGGRYVGMFRNLKRNGNGTYYYPTGSVYVGEWKDDSQDGYGSLTYLDQDFHGRRRFEGQFKHGLRSSGTLIFKNGEKYVGDFEGGSITGQGTYFYSDGTKYVGEWLIGKRFGFGTLYSSDGKKLNEGEWKDDAYVENDNKPSENQATKYVGELVNGKRHGYGFLTFPGNDDFRRISFEGLFENDEYKNGTMLWKNGEKYVGTFKNSKRHGHGTTSYASGSQHIGEWSDDLQNGHGMFIYSDNDVYDRKTFDGEYSNGKRLSGTLIFKNGDEYVGNFSNGTITGQGTRKYSDGSKYVGEWLSNQRMGHGTLYSSNGKILHEGEWKDDKFVG